MLCMFLFQTQLDPNHAKDSIIVRSSSEISPLVANLPNLWVGMDTLQFQNISQIPGLTLNPKLIIFEHVEEN